MASRLLAIMLFPILAWAQWSPPESDPYIAAKMDSVRVLQLIQAIPGGSGLPNYASVKRIADTTYSTATPVGIGGMSFAVTGATYYSFRYVLIYQTAATTTGIKLALTYPAVTTASARVTIAGQAADGATTEPWVGTINSSGDVVTSTAVAVQNVNYVATIEGNILPSADGTLVLQWSPEVAAAATLKRGSVGYIWSF